MRYLVLVLVLVSSFCSADNKVNIIPIINYLLSDSKPPSPLYQIKQEFNVKNDKYQQTTYYNHKNNTYVLTPNIAKNFMQITIGDKKEQNDNHSVTLFLDIVRYSQELSYFNKLIFLIDGIPEEIDSSNFYSDLKYPGFGSYYVYTNTLLYFNLSYSLGTKGAVIIKKISNANNVSVKMYSPNSNIEYIYTNKDIEAVRDGLKLYNLLVELYKKDDNIDNKPQDGTLLQLN